MTMNYLKVELIRTKVCEEKLKKKIEEFNKAIQLAERFNLWS